MTEHLGALVAAGLVRNGPRLRHQRAGYQITAGGLREIGSELPVPRLALRRYWQDIGVAWLLVTAHGGGFGEVRVACPRQQSPDRVRLPQVRRQRRGRLVRVVHKAHGAGIDQDGVAARHLGSGLPARERSAGSYRSAGASSPRRAAHGSVCTAPAGTRRAGRRARRPSRDCFELRRAPRPATGLATCRSPELGRMCSALRRGSSQASLVLRVPSRTLG